MFSETVAPPEGFGVDTETSVHEPANRVATCPLGQLSVEPGNVRRNVASTLPPAVAVTGSVKLTCCVELFFFLSLGTCVPPLIQASVLFASAMAVTLMV